ncbi:hypothetical protein MN608_10544 [Microdochium nivale]|nr:hypothetical protein MN608_10544 [Microdochium nivale]
MAVGKYANIWGKRHNLAAWILQTIASLIILGWFIYSMVRVASWANGLIIIDAILVIIFVGSTLIFNLVEVILYCKGTLNPVVLLVFAVFKTLFWGFMFFVTLIAHARSARTRIIDPISLVTSLVLFGTAVSQLVIGAIFVHRKRKGTLRDARAGRAGHNVSDQAAKDAV